MPRRLAIALVVLAALVAVPESAARVDGPCVASIGGQDVSTRDTGPLSDPIDVDDDSPMSVTMSSTEPIEGLKVEIEFGGVRWTVHERETTGSSWASEVPVDEYAPYAVGIFKIVGTSFGRDFTCTGAALVDVEGDEPLDPLVTVAGLFGLTFGLIGALGVLGVTLRAGKTGAAPVLSSAFFGLVFGGGLGLLLQQFSVVYPTIGVAGALLAGGAAVGLVFSLFGLPARSDAR
jgi:hypothetical protein